MTAVMRALLFSLLFVVCQLQAATFSWIPPTMYEIPPDRAVQPGEIQKFTIYCREQGSQTFVQLFEVPGTATSASHAPCVAEGKNEFVITAWADGRESRTSDIKYLDTSPASLNKTQLTCQPCPTCDVPVPSPPPPPPPTAEVWLTQTNGTETTRPVYSLNGFVDALPDERIEIGRIDIKVPCGEFVKEYSATSKTLSWRKVTIAGANGPGVTGVTVCKKP